MKLIIGLGNPGKEYENTRHNVGFMFLDYYLNKKDNPFNWSEKFNGLYTSIVVNDEKIIFLKPLSYMNLSGGVVRKFCDFFKIDFSDILVISDDLDLNIGNFKLKPNGSAGGHNGLKDIERNINTQEYKRFKVGISNDKTRDTKDYVLGRFTKSDLDVLENVFNELCNALDDYFDYDFSKLMNKYNKKNR